MAPYDRPVPDFDVDATFGDDYLHFTGAYLSDDRSDDDTAAVLQLLAPGPGARILDAPCGHGRIANRLAAHGMEVWGVDRTAPFLTRGRHESAGRPRPAHFAQGDLRQLPLSGPFDAVVCWFTSFGYFDDDDNRQVLREFRRVLRPGGTLLVETLHHDGVVRHFTAAPDATVSESGGDLQVDVHRFDPGTGRIETDRTTVRDGRVRRSHHFVRLPTVPEWRVWLDGAGFAASEVCEPDGTPLTLDSWRMAVTARA